MDKLFRYETDLVNSFISHRSIENQHLLINEMNVRWGNIDVVEINNSSLPFTQEQCLLLSKPSAAKIFMRLKNNRAISKTTLFVGLGLSESTFTHTLSALVKCGLVCKTNNLYSRNVCFNFPSVTITGYEAKLTDYNKAFYQARNNKQYVDYSYMVFPLNEAQKIYTKHHSTIEQLNIGLIGVSSTSNTTLIKPIKRDTPKPYIRLMNLAISQNYAFQKAVIS